MTPLDDQWYIHTRFIFHMTVNGGNLTSYSNMTNNTTISSDHNVLVINHVNALVPNPHHYLTLNSVLHA